MALSTVLVAPRALRSAAVLASLACSFVVVFAARAEAHVKWFCAFDVAAQPRGLKDVIGADLGMLMALAIVTFVAGCALERTRVGPELLIALDRVTTDVLPSPNVLLRAVVAGFFIAVWSTGGILLTPELKTTSASVSVIQFGIAVGLMSCRTTPLSALGIAALFVIAVSQYGAFHLADYPIFLGVAACLGLTALKAAPFGIRPMDILRWSAGLTLMWASVEKWAYPQWSFPLFLEHPTLNAGFDDEFVLQAAGVIEFTLAFALLWTPLVRRMAAVVLATMFVAACFEFGKLDVIGHAPIVATLLVLAADPVRAREPSPAVWRAPVALGVSLVLFILVYYGAHAVLFGSTIL